MELPKRKQLRLKHYDYSTNGAYFVTICTHDMHKLFGEIVAENSISAYESLGINREIVGADSISARMVADTFNKTLEKFSNVQSPKFVVMPNHFHAIIEIQRADMESAPTLPEIIQNFKRYSTIEYIKLVKAGAVPPFDKKVWQRTYHEHIIRNEKRYREVWEYIENNPLKWIDDCYYKK